MTQNDLGGLPDYIPDWFSLEVAGRLDSPHSHFYKDFYLRLISCDSPEMKKAWRSLDKRYKDNKGKYVEKYFLLKLFDCSAIGPSKYEMMTISEIRDITSRMDSAIEDLVKIMAETSTDFELSFIKKVGNQNWTFSHVLRWWRKEAGYEIGERRKIIERPGSGDVRKRYFCDLPPPVVPLAS